MAGCYHPSGPKGREKALISRAPGQTPRDCWKYPPEKPAPYEKLSGDLAGAFSQRITLLHRLVYQVAASEKAVKALYIKNST